MRKLARLLIWLLQEQMRVHPQRILKVLRGLPRFIKDYFRFRRLYKGKVELLPCLTDWGEEGGSAHGEYFWQDLYIARKIHVAKPLKHVDIGSRVDGFVAHVASFREIEVFDIRAISTTIPGIVFRQADMMIPDDSLKGYCDSLSCLHALEHFGLGRYGDPINPNGPEVALQNMSNMLANGGLMYLAVPIGKSRVEFNGLRVFEPSFVEELALKMELELQEFSYLNAHVALTTSRNPQRDFTLLASQEYSLGIYIFIKRG